MPRSFCDSVADIGEAAAARTRGQAAVLDPSAALVEHHRQDAVERAGGVEVLEIELLEELPAPAPSTRKVMRRWRAASKSSTVGSSVNVPPANGQRAPSTPTRTPPSNW